MGDVTAYPLAWPRHRPRTPHGQRRDAAFRSADHRTGSKPVSLPDARDRLQRELDLLRANYVVLSTNLELRLNGQPRADRVQPADPGVACYFRLKGKPIVLACDRWNAVAANIAAIAEHVGALRGMDRWGVGSVEQAFEGFAALPDPITNDWRALLGEPPTLAAAEAAYRERMKAAHPDIGGSHAQAAALNAAIAEARKVLT